MDRDNTEEDYPFKCDTVIHTGHRGNVFNAQMLPHSSRMYVIAALWNAISPRDSP